MHPIFYGTINHENGDFSLDNPKRFKTYLTSLKFKGVPTKIELTVRRYRKKRSDKQNRYYWLCLNVIAQDIGENPEDLHTTFKSMFLTDRSKEFPVVRSTTTLNSKEFTDYMDKIAVQVGAFGITLPNPDEAYG